jgi:hypothetical protein
VALPRQESHTADLLNEFSSPEKRSESKQSQPDDDTRTGQLD